MYEACHLFLLIPYIRSILERIPESYIQIDGIHGKCNGVEFFLEDVIQSPSEVCVNIQVLESFPFASQLHSPLEFAKIFGEVVGCNAFAAEVYREPVWSGVRRCPSYTCPEKFRSMR